jgi:hypothetical protein
MHRSNIQNGYHDVGVTAHIWYNRSDALICSMLTFDFVFRTYMGFRKNIGSEGCAGCMVDHTCCQNMYMISIGYAFVRIS